MRSSVSVILSSPSRDQSMSRPDYDQTIHDHSSMLILLRVVGDGLSMKNFSNLFERISKISFIKIKENNGNERIVWSRFLKEYPVGNNDWGEFQTHRRLLGLITLGKCKTEAEFNEICRVHESLKVKYQSTLYDSRCIVFGVNTDDTLKIRPPSNFKSQAIYFSAETDTNSDLEKHVTEFLSSVFWILESKRLEKNREKLDKAQLLLAPLEKKDFIGIDMKSHNNRKRCAGRLTKHLGDLSLQAGLLNEALTFYHSAMDTLRSINDWLWIAGSAEGLCAASALYLMPRADNNTTLHRNASLPEKQLRQKFASSKSSENIMNMSLSLPRNVLPPEEIYKLYREAIIHYSKFQNAGVIEMEACFKGARIAVKYNSPLQAHTLLQNVMLINFSMNEEEKIQRLMGLSKLYTSIGFHKKASFYRRLTATHYVSARNPQTNWEQCYQLMLQSLTGYNLSLDPNEYISNETGGWPCLQRQVLHDLVVAATRLSNNGLATRHMTFFLQIMWHHISSDERKELALKLKKLAELCEGSPVPLILDNGFVIPPANLLNIPLPSNFAVQNLRIPLRPHKLLKAKEDYGPFLFTPLPLTPDKRRSKKNDNKLDYCWVAEEICQVLLEIDNPLPFDLDITNMLLLTSGVVFESIPVSVVLPGKISNQTIILTGIPKEVGTLDIRGYSTHTLGVKSNCRLRYIPTIPFDSLTLEVVPALPLLDIFVSPSEAVELECDKKNNHHPLVLYTGERSECSISLKNKGVLPIEFIDVIIESTLEPSIQNKIIDWDRGNFMKQLPLAPNSTGNLPLKLFGLSHFLAHNYHSSNYIEGSSQKSSIVSSGVNSFPSLSSPKATLGDPNTPLSLSTSSFRSAGSSLNSFSYMSKTNDTNSKLIEFTIKVRYSGGPGFKEGYCRMCSLVLQVEILNSVLITNWDVMPAETCSQFYLVLDVMNMTSQEIEVNYSKSKLIQIEENETCRIPVAVDRCPLSTLERLFQVEDEVRDNFEMHKICSEHIALSVDLRWKMNDDRHGIASLEGLTLSTNMLDVVRVPPVNWEIKLNAVPIDGVEPVRYSVGELLQLTVCVNNSLPKSLLDITSQLCVYQDHQNGMTNQPSDTCLSIIGSNRIQFPQIDDCGQVLHECNIIFFNPGQYNLNIFCSSFSNKYVWKRIPSLQIIVN